MREDEISKKKREKGQEGIIQQKMTSEAKKQLGFQKEFKSERGRFSTAKEAEQNIKECFNSRLRFTINIAELSTEQLERLPSFKGILKSEWNKARHIIYYSQEELHCVICLQKNFQAPQMTSCGHVFCWHCILMYFHKALKACYCPVCNQAFEVQNVVSCQPLYNNSFEGKENDAIDFVLRARKEGDSRIYDLDTLTEDLNFAKLMKATPQKIVQILSAEKETIEENIKNCQDQELLKWLLKVRSLSLERVEKAKTIAASKETSPYYSHGHRRRKINLSNGYIYSVLSEKERKNLISFYQQKSGRFIFLNQICWQFLQQSSMGLPRQISAKIAYWQEVEYGVDLLKALPQISHLTINQEIDLMILDIEKYIDEALIPAFHEKVEAFKKKKKEELDRQQKQSQRLSVEYRKKKRLQIKLKIMQQEQFKNLNVPTQVNINENMFPSLIDNRTKPDLQTRSEYHSFDHEKTDRKISLGNNDFPQMMIKRQSSSSQFAEEEIEVPSMIQATKSEQVVVVHGLGKGQAKKGRSQNRKKEKYTKMPGLFFQPGCENNSA